jgi:hypothetical protein
MMLATGAGDTEVAIEMPLIMQNAAKGKAFEGAAESVGEKMATVMHFTSQEGVQAIGASGNVLKAGTFVTLPSEVEGMSAAEVETALEIQAGRGTFSTTFQTPLSNVMTPFNGPITSGGATQFQLINPTLVGPFVPTP